MTNEPPQDAIQAAETAAAATTPPPADEAAATELLSFVPLADLSDTTETSIDDRPPATDLENAPPTLSPDDIALESSEPTVVAPEATAVNEFDSAPGLNPSPVASPVSAETLDFSSLVTRLRRTKAIGLRTKVAVKNESDELLNQFRAYHTQNGIVTLVDLRRSYESLFLRLHSLLEDADPPLARDIDRSQAAIWELLADPTQFRASNLMAGA